MVVGIVGGTFGNTEWQGRVHSKLWVVGGQVLTAAFGYFLSGYPHGPCTIPFWLAWLGVHMRKFDGTDGFFPGLAGTHQACHLAARGSYTVPYWCSYKDQFSSLGKQGSSQVEHSEASGVSKLHIYA